MTAVRRLTTTALALLVLPALLYTQRPAPASAQDETTILRARVAELEATQLALRQELAQERTAAQALRAERDSQAAALSAAQAELARLRSAGSPAGGSEVSGTGTPLTGAPAVIRMQVGRPEVQADDTWYATDVPPTVLDGRVMLPVRAVAELLGLQVEWDSATRTVTLRR